MNTSPKVLVACESTQGVTKELRSMGIEAYSCDIVGQAGGYDEYHIMQDVLPLLAGNCKFKTQDGVEHEINGKWDMIIAFPPCTHLSVSGAPSFERKRKDGRQREGLEFFCQFLKADCDRIMIENPVNIVSGKYVKKWFPDICTEYNLPRKPTQRIHPWMFGENVSKTTCLWLKGLNPLIPDVSEQPELEWYEWINKKTGKKRRTSMLHHNAFMNSKTDEERRNARAMKFIGIQTAMAKQFGKQLLDCFNSSNGGENER